MVLKLDLYQVFLTVGKVNSFSQAARELYMTQPAVSQSIAQLETELDTKLFNRSSKGVALTHEGELLFEYVDSAINLLHTGEDKLLELKNLSAGELRIGIGDTISRHFVLPFIQKFNNQYPKIKLKIINGTTMEICDYIKSGEVDIGVCNLPIDDSALEIMPCYEIQDIFVCGEKYKTLTTKPQPLEKITQVPLILLESSSNSRKYVEEYVQTKGISLSPEFEIGSYDLLLELAKINLGVSCVIKEFSVDYLKTGDIYEITLQDPIPKRNIGICHLNSVPLSPASSKFVEIVMG